MEDYKEMSSSCPEIVISSPLKGPPEEDSHPLLIPKVLHLTLAHFSKDLPPLKSFRLVCQSWNEAVCLHLKELEEVQFTHIKSISKYLCVFGGGRGSLDSMAFPHGRFSFNKIRLNLIFDNFILKKFFKKFSAQINSLQLDFTGPQFRFKYLKMCILDNLGENLTRVSLTFKDYYEIWPGSLADEPQEVVPLRSVQFLKIYGYGREATLKTVLIRILPYFPNLKGIEAGEQIGRLIFDILFKNKEDDVRSLKNPLPFLKELDFNFLYPAEIQTILKFNVNLTCLKAEIHCEEDQLRNLLEFLAPSLKRLELSGIVAKQNFPQLLVPMSSLEHLQLERFSLNLSTLQSFPSLKSLWLKLIHFNTEGLEDFIPIPNPNLSYLTIEINSMLDPNLILVLGAMFPKIRKLDLPFYIFDNKRNLFGIICKEMGNLEELHLSLSKEEEF